MRLSEFQIDEGWSSVLKTGGNVLKAGGGMMKSIAAGVGKGVASAAGYTPGTPSQTSIFIKEFARRIDGQLKRAISSGLVVADASHVTTLPTPNKWDPSTNKLTSGKTNLEYKRQSTGDWQLTSDPWTNYPAATKHAQALEQAMTTVIADTAHAAAGDMPDLSEQKFRKLNKIFEQMLQEAPLGASIQDYVFNLAEKDLEGTTISSVQTNDLKQACAVVQQQYASPGSYIKALNNLGKIVYSIASK